MQLRPYQQQLYNDIKLQLKRGKKSVCAVLGCGGGKSVVEAAIAKSATDKNNRVLFLIHRKELSEQIKNTFTRCGVNMSLCQITMVQSAKNLSEPKLIITDECHHALSKSYTQIYDSFPNATRIGFTATPVRLGEGGLGKVFDAMCEGASTSWLIKNNFLAPYEYYSVRLASADGLHSERGDYVKKEIAELMEKNQIYGDTIKSYKKIANGKQAIVYCASVQASKDTAKAFAENGISAAHIDGKTAADERERLVDMFKRGEITVLCNVELFGEGFDVPDCECVILLRPTKSLTLHIQQSMRSMRYKKGKTAIIIDHVGNCYRHGFPDDRHLWDLSSGKHKQVNLIKIKECPVCFRCLPQTTKICPECLYDFTEQLKAETDKEAEAVKATLERIDTDERLKNLTNEDISKMQSFYEVDEVRKARGYNWQWTLHQCVRAGIKIPAKYRNAVRRIVL